MYAIQNLRQFWPELQDVFGKNNIVFHYNMVVSINFLIFLCMNLFVLPTVFKKRFFITDKYVNSTCDNHTELNTTFIEHNNNPMDL